MTVLCQKRTYLADLVPLPSEGVSFPPDAACMSGAPPVAWGAFSLRTAKASCGRERKRFMAFG